MQNNQFYLTFTTDLDQGAKMVPLCMAFLRGDNESHVFSISTMRDGKKNNLSGASVYALFSSVHGDTTIKVKGNVNANGAAVVALPAECYELPGHFKITICAEMDGTVSSIFFGEGFVGHYHKEKVVEVDTGTVDDDAELSEDGEGNATVTGVMLTVDDVGNGTLTGATLIVDSEGNATIQ